MTTLFVSLDRELQSDKAIITASPFIKKIMFVPNVIAHGNSRILENDLVSLRLFLNPDSQIIMLISPPPLPSCN